ncbi:MAG TPA: hypothetical protein QF646_00905 [Candidatus Poseidoniales archaeon]|nr:hypothetical protein [Candidatus Poseidoniales archaeon]
MGERLKRGLNELIRQNEARSQLPFLKPEAPEGNTERTAWTIERIGGGEVVNVSDAESSIKLAKGITLTLKGALWTLDARGTVKEPLPIVPSDLRFLGELIEPIDERRRSFTLQLDMWSQDIERLIGRLIEHKRFDDR